MATEKTYYKEFRCTECQRLLFKGLLVESEVEVKCKRCGQLNTFVGEPASVYHCPHAPQCPQHPKNAS